MSALKFVRRNQARGGMSPSCAIRPCTGTGLYRWQLLGYAQGSVCTRHRNELMRAWDSARTTTIGEAA